MTKRLLPPTDLPGSLWRKDQDSLYVPQSLCAVYKAMLDEKELLEEAGANSSENGPVGGISEEATRKHFATRFSASAARTQLALLDPKDRLENVSDLFIKAFSGGRVGLLDIPSGAGAASADLLATVAALREAGILPRQPLEVMLVAGDISQHARLYFSEMMAGMKEALELQGIFVHLRFEEWDVLDADSTTALLHSWMEWAHDCREYFVIMANFSGFLQAERKFKAAGLQLDEVFRWAAQRRSTVMWLEPQTNTAVKGLFPRILKWIEKKLPRRFRASWDKSERALTTESKYVHPIKLNYRPRANLSLIRLEASDQ